MKNDSQDLASSIIRKISIGSHFREENKIKLILDPHSFRGYEPQGKDKTVWQKIREKF